MPFTNCLLNITKNIPLNEEIVLIKEKFFAKVLIVGDYSVGKTALNFRYANKLYKEYYLPTLGVEFSCQTIYVEDKEVEMQIWDFSGHKDFNNLRKKLFKGASALILVFDLTNKTSLHSLERWLKEVNRNQKNQQIPIFICGNKFDLEPHKISSSEIEDYIQNLSEQFEFPMYIEYFKTSAKTGKNVEECFNHLAQKIVAEIPISA